MTAISVEGYLGQLDNGNFVGWLLTGILFSGVCFLLLKSGALGLDNIRNNFDLEFNEEDHSKQQITHGKMDEKVIWEN